MAKKQPSSRNSSAGSSRGAKIEAVRHKDKRKNIPTEELRGFVQEAEQRPKQVTYPGLLYARDPSLDPQLVWKGKDEQDREPLTVPAVPIYIQEKIHPQVIIEDVRTQARKAQPADQMELFADFNGIAFEEMIEFYRHEANWSNRMILGDSLLVMTSLAEKEGLKGKVQTIYIDPPYGIKFGSNWQVSTRKRDVKDGKAEDATRQPEQIRAFRDTWELGIHSYLAYWRDRLIVARELLTESGSVFVQIGDENVHLVRCILDEVFGSENHIATIQFVTTTSQTADFVPCVNDYVLWYAKDIEHAKFRQLLLPKKAEEAEESAYARFEVEGKLTETKPAAGDWRLLVFDNLTSRSGGEATTQPFEFQGRKYVPKSGGWKTNVQGLQKLAQAARLHAKGDTLLYKRYFADFPFRELTNFWTDTQSGGFGKDQKIYVVQTNAKVIARCLLMTTDPGDLVLDPTCFRAGTRVKTESGWKTIETVRPGERVWTHRGRLRRVVGVQARPHVGPMVGLRVRGGEATVWMTPEHRILAATSAPPPAPTPHPSPSDREGNGERTPHPGQTAPPLAPPQTPPLAPPHRMGRGWGEVHAALGGKPGRAKIQFARTLRKEATNAEDFLWQELRGRRLAGAKFRRQHPLGPHYVADFYCPEARLAVELDGSIHAVDRKHWGDGLRHGQMQMLAGVRVLRFENQRVIGDMEGVLREIAEHLASPLYPSPSDGEGPGVGSRDVLPESPAPAPLPTRGEGPGVGTPAQREVAWCEARSLQPGDRVVGDECGAVLEIESVLHEHGTETVYDLTVEEDHSFVTEVAVAHNCGSGTTAYVAEQWGRRWITIDTSRVAIALARTRLMAAKFPYYLLADSPEGQKQSMKDEGGRMNTDGKPVFSASSFIPHPSSFDVRKGFVYRRVPHVTLKSIANNPDIKEGMSREEIDRAIARHADTELLYDQPYEDGKRIRVTGPFTVESLSPHRTISVEEKKSREESGLEGWKIKEVGPNQFGHIVMENLKKAGVQNTIKQERLHFDRLEPFAGTWLHAAGEYTERDGKSRRVAVCIGPEHGTVGPELVREAAKEAVKGVGFDLLLVCGFAFDPHVNEEAKQYGKLVVLPTRINADLHMGDEFLKKTGAGNLFTVFGEPDIEISKSKDGKIVVEIKGLDIYDPTTGQIRSHTTDDIACWFIDTNYNGESFFVRHAYFTGADQPYDKLKRALKAEINEEAWSALYSTRSRPFDQPETGKIAIKVINHYGDEVLKVHDCKTRES